MDTPLTPPVPATSNQDFAPASVMPLQTSGTDILGNKFGPDVQGDTGTLPEQIGTGAYNGFNSVALGIPDLLLKTVASPAYQAIQKARADNPNASRVGDILGLGSSFLAPAGTVSKVASKGLEAGGNLLRGGKAITEGAAPNLLDKGATALANTSDYLGQTGGTFGQQVLRNAGIAAEQQLPRAATDYGTTGNFDPAGLALSIGGGGLLGGTLNYGAGKIGQALAKEANPVGNAFRTLGDEVGKTNTDAILSGADVNKGVLKTIFNEQAKRLNLDKAGHIFNNVDDFKEGLADFITSHNLGDKLTREHYLDSVPDKWQTFTDEYNASPLQTDIGQTPIQAGGQLALEGDAPSTFTQNILNDPRVAPFLNDPNLGPEGVNNILQTMTKGITNDGGQIADYNQAKNFLNQRALNASKLQDTAQSEAALSENQAKQAIAHSILEQMDNHLDSIDPSHLQAKADYPYERTLRVASGREQLKVENPIEEGSPTQKNLMAGNLISNALQGAGVGSMLGPDDNRTGGGIIGAGVGLLGGTGLARGMGKLVTQAQAGIAGNIRNSGIISKIGQSIGTTLSQAPAKAIALGQDVNKSLNQDDSSPTLVAPQNQPKEPAPQPNTPPPLSTGPVVSNASFPGSPKTPQPPVNTPPAQATQSLPAGVHPQMANPQYQSSVLNRLQTIYNTDKELQMSGVSFPQFINQVQVHTNGFDPRFMGKVFFDNPEMQAKYQKDVTTAQQLKALPLNEIINDSYNPVAFMDAGKNLDKQKFQALLNNGKPMAKPEAEQLDRNLQGIATLPQAKKSEALTSLLKATYGIDIPTLASLGAY